MRNTIKINLLISIFFLVVVISFNSCSKIQEEPLDRVNNLSAFYDGKDQVLYIKKGLTEEVHEVIKSNADQHEELEKIANGTIKFTQIETENPFVFAMKFEYDFVDSVYPYYFRVYSKAECGQLHPGFISECMGVPDFHPKAPLYKSMDWSINDWYSCKSGSSTCIEGYYEVGRVNYYLTLNCMDTLALSEPIYRFTCLKGM